MNTFKKIGLGLVALFMVITLAGCQKTSPDTNIITMKGATISVTDMYAEAKTFPNLPVTTLLQNLTFSHIFEKEFGKQVTDKDVTDKFNETKKQMGDSFSSVLQQKGMTEDNYKVSLRLQLLQQKAIDKQIKETQYTEANLKSAWETYHPEVKTYIASSNSKDDANKMRDLAINNSDEFKSQAKDNGLEVNFDSSNTAVPAKIQTAAFKLQNSKVSDVIAVPNDQTGNTDYYVIYMISNPGKGDDMNKYKDQLKNYIRVQKENDQTFVIGVFKKYLTKYNVTIKETSFNNIFSNFSGISD